MPNEATNMLTDPAESSGRDESQPRRNGNGVSTTYCLHAEDVPWSTLGPGVEMRIVHADSSTGRWSAFIHMHAGSRLIPHRHIGASEFVVMEGTGVHPQAGAFRPGDYAWESAGAVHSEVNADHKIMLFMVSHGSSEFLKKDGSPWFTSDAAYFERLRNTSSVLRWLKRFLLIRVWRLLRRRSRLDAATGEATGNVTASEGSGVNIVNAHAVPWLPIYDDVEARRLHVDPELQTSTMQIRVAPAASLTTFDHRSTSEMIVLDGSGTTDSGQVFRAGDYCRNDAGEGARTLSTAEGFTIVWFGHRHVKFRSPDGVTVLPQ